MAPASAGAFRGLGPAAFDPDQGQRPGHPTKSNRYGEKVRRAAMPASPYRRSPREPCAKLGIRKTATAGADRVSIVRWPNSANGNAALNSMQRLSQFRARGESNDKLVARAAGTRAGL